MVSIAVSAASQELVDAIKVTTERLDDDGTPWCPPVIGDMLMRVIANRGREVSGLLRQAVRLARLMERVAPRDGYLVTLHMRLSLLRTRQFKQLFDQAFARGALQGIAERTDGGIQLLEPEMASGDKQFDLSFAQMPAAAAFLDIAHNMLGFPRIAEICAGLLAAIPSTDAESVSRQLSSEINTWLKGRAADEHGLRQARAITKYLAARGDLLPSAINNEAILNFWEEAGSTTTDVDGFKLFRSAVRHLLFYREALAAAMLDTAEAASLSQEREVGGVDLEILTIDAEGAPTVLYGAMNETWRSPLAGLFEPPADRVKWLTKLDREFLADLLQDRGLAEGDERVDAMFGGPPLPELMLTFARYAYFGRLQNALVEAVKRSRNDQIFVVEPDYGQLASRLRRVSEELTELLGATAWALIIRRSPMGAALSRAFDTSALEAFAMQEAASFKNVVALERWDKETTLFRSDDIASTAQLVMTKLAQPGSSLGNMLRRAYKAVNRAGFRPQDAEDVLIAEGMEAGAEYLELLRTEVAAAAEALDGVLSPQSFQGDCDRFGSRFLEMYGLRLERGGSPKP